MYSKFFGTVWRCLWKLIGICIQAERRECHCGVVLSNQFKTCIAKIRRVLLMETRAPLTRLLKERIRSDKCVSARRIEDPGWK